jgi:hypothetical protein
MVNKHLKRVNEKSVLLAVFILLAILAIGSLVVMKPRLTGFAVVEGYATLEECEAVEGQVWYEGVCYDEQPVCASDFLELCLDETTCTDAAGYWYDDLCNAEEAPVCDVDYVELCLDETTCTDAAGYWYDAIDDEETILTCNDVVEPACDNDLTLCDETNCVDVGGGYWYDSNADETLTCNAEVEPACDNDLTLCDETNCVDVGGGYWYGDECNVDVECVDTCSSLNYECGSQTVCGVSTECGSCNSGYSCVSGSCEEDIDDDDDDTSSDDTSSDDTITGNVIEGRSSCVSNWECGEWTACTGGTQTRECTDIHNCVTPTENLNAMSLPCTGSGTSGTSDTQETCSDGIKNQDEKGIDCGGACEERCGFFRIVGNAVNVPINSSKQFVQNNKAISFSLLGVILLAVSWIVCVKVFLKKKNVFFFLEHVDWSKCVSFFKGKKKTNPNNM